MKMAIKVGYEGKWLVRIRLNGQDIKVTTPARNKKEAREMDAAITSAVRYEDFSSLGSEARKVCIRLYKNRGWPLPPTLIDYTPSDNCRRNVTLWEAIRLTLETLANQGSKNIQRHEQALTIHVGPYFGKDHFVEDIGVPEIRKYFSARVKQGAAPSTVNKDRAALSMMFKCLIEQKLVDDNPVRQVKPMKEAAKREVYVSHEDFRTIVGYVPRWLKPILKTLYYTGMRRSEVMNLTWDNVLVQKRIIRLSEHETKERKAKRVPLRREVVQLLEDLHKSYSGPDDRVFLINGLHTPSIYSLRKPWKKALRLTSALPENSHKKFELLTIHDLRHVWKTNALRSGMDMEIRETILGHTLGISGRYGHLSDDDLVRAVDQMTFEKGETEIWLPGLKK